MLFFWHHNLKKRLRLTNAGVLRSAKRCCNVCLYKTESLVAFHTLSLWLGGYSAFRQKLPKLWTSVAHSFLQQIAQNKSWAHPKATSSPRIYKVEMEHASLLFYLAKPQSGGVLGCDLCHCTSEPFDFRPFQCWSLPSVDLRSVLTVPCVVKLLS